jgi:hypothetical protein
MQVPLCGTPTPRSTASKSEFSSDVNAALRRDHGPQALAGLNDARVQKLEGYYIAGEEYPGFNADKCMGKGWERQDTGDFFVNQFRLCKDPNGSSQTVTFDGNNKSITISSVVPQGLIETTLETITKNEDGKVTRERMTAV